MDENTNWSSAQIAILGEIWVSHTAAAPEYLIVVQHRRATIDTGDRRLLAELGSTVDTFLAASEVWVEDASEENLLYAQQLCQMRGQ